MPLDKAEILVLAQRYELLAKGHSLTSQPFFRGYGDACKQFAAELRYLLGEAPLPPIPETPPAPERPLPAQSPPEPAYDTYHGQETDIYADGVRPTCDETKARAWDASSRH